MLENFKTCIKNFKKILKKNGKVYFQINIPKDNNIFQDKIKNYDELFLFLNRFFKINNFLIFEKKMNQKSKLKTIQDSCLIECELR